MVSLAQRGDVGAPPRRAPRPSSVQLKYVMAVSGAIMFLYLVAHMVGNLKIFLGAESIDLYAEWLRVVGEPAVPAQTVLWIVRVVLLAAVIGHIVAATMLARRAAKARPVKYAHRSRVEGSYAARTMRWGGVIIALFIVYHILDLTTGTLNPNGQYGEVYANVVADFAPQRWYVTLFYVLAVVAVALHLRHGLWSALQSLGRTSERNRRAVRATANVVAIGLAVGFLAVPISVTFGWVG
ncbi:succinate dehydrogenase cytochrome b subunit [Pseudonocardia broussonetiae]|uniref:Succinate dehydrogenase cytochrome b subunit n=1 Tax=Pseudonocardia broussonetiae TaxID=2736640 RepID=A0A6M6JLQ9_9PSEU|nr:succinate dehydrogenase cytochrome b subunit [Pseudonocardia broussonetiae]QJY47339.1 succinate dehydrogenase cytochrome b subunit [Pseudonocardia broussonetiae]